MNRMASLFLMIVTPALAICLALLGLATFPSNPLGWFLNDKKSAIDEMIRVAKHGARILIADETEKGAQGYEKLIPGFKKSFGGKRSEIVPPLDLVPTELK